MLKETFEVGCRMLYASRDETSNQFEREAFRSIQMKTSRYVGRCQRHSPASSDVCGRASRTSSPMMNCLSLADYYSDDQADMKDDKSPSIFAIQTAGSNAT